MKVLILRVLKIFWLLAFLPMAQARERLEFYNGVRALGMGGATIAVVNDETAVLQNPAALGKLRDYFITIVDPELVLSEEAQAVVGDDIFAFTDPQEIFDKVKAKPKRYFYQKAQVFPSIVLKNFGFGVFGKYETSAFVNKETNKLDMQYINDFAGVLGINFRLFDGIIKVGANARLVNRSIIDKDDFALSTAHIKVKTQGAEGIGLASDVGLIITSPTSWLPTLTAVYRDVGNTSYDLGSGLLHNTTDRPDKTPATLDAGFALFPLMGNETRLSLAGELRDVLKKVEDGKNGRAEDSVQRRTHVGVELNMSDILFLRAGMNQRYWTAGAELSFSFYQFQVATYGEDVGTKNDPREDRRYVFKFAWRF